jgi:hypothetical protein
MYNPFAVSDKINIDILLDLSGIFGHAVSRDFHFDNHSSDSGLCLWAWISLPVDNVLQELWVILNLLKIAECMEMVFRFLIANIVGTDLAVTLGMFQIL